MKPREDSAALRRAADANLRSEVGPSSRDDRTAAAISIEHLSKTYPTPLLRLRQLFRRRTPSPVEALADVSFDVREGEIFGLIGRNGAGKTTLLKIIATLVQPTAGAVTVRGFDSVRDEERVRASIGMASAEERSFYWRLTVEQNLMFFARLYGLGERDARRRIDELLSRIELEEMRRRRFGELSTGNKQRMAVARALLSNPPVVLLDEPTRSLDPVAAARMRSLISSLATGDSPTTVLLTSHNLAEIEELCERVAIISRGRIRSVDTPQSLRSQHRQKERVTLTLRGIPTARAAELFSTKEADGAAAGEAVSVFDGRDGACVVTFTREHDDDQLDRHVRRLLESGAELLACETERSTLLDVLEIYESEAEERAHREAVRPDREAALEVKR